MSIILTGIAASQGIAAGKVLCLTEQAKAAAICCENPIESLKEAISISKKELTELHFRVKSKAGEKAAAVFDAHIMMLEDQAFLNPLYEAVNNGIDVVTAVQNTSDEIASIFLQMDDSYMRERAADLADISRRIIRHLTGQQSIDWNSINEPVIIAAHDLSPSDTAQFDPDFILGFVTEVGGKTSHSAILARTLGIPAIVGIPQLLSQIKNSDSVIVDGNRGYVIVNPTKDNYKKYEKELQNSTKLSNDNTLPAVSTDGRKFELAANIGMPRDVKAALQNGAESIGLYRTEFLFMNHVIMPTEEEQYQAYKEVLEKMNGRPVIIRTLDIGGDKHLPYLDMPQEENPFLGWRAIRMCLERPELFKTQLKALWRAGCHGNLRVMFPMISNLAEVRQAKEMLYQAKEELQKEGRPTADNLILGIMIELPSAALIADQLIQEVDFFSIGSNDLIQYTLGVDRMNSKIAGLYQPLHPGVLKLISMVIDAAHHAGKWVGMCGEMAGDPHYIPVLAGFGLDEFSMSANAIPAARSLIQSLSVETCKEIASQSLAAATMADVENLWTNSRSSWYKSSSILNDTATNIPK